MNKNTNKIVECCFKKNETKKGGIKKIERKLTLMIVTPATIIHAHPLSVSPRDILSIMIVRFLFYIHVTIPLCGRIVQGETGATFRFAFVSFASP